eukprot:CAMPEP_0198117276 /NCGR_PEP_ID=MMETSP1442-20131203/17505_1 /TAXON_ID= /ORGANISM="Craspedostauros australis, Strain CCMP3328" /LENGTH=371 /DNA_ID=CAMNT_0043775295 /DNA_START=5 /DNA_END=1120 /DNA_ORIENTATION=-
MTLRLSLLLVSVSRAAHGFGVTTTTSRYATRYVAPATTRRLQSSATAATETEQSTNIIDGKTVAMDIRSELRQRLSQLASVSNSTAAPIIPGLAVILVGSRRDSQTYVNMKKKACADVGIASYGYDYEESVTQAEILSKVQELNEDDNVHGILIQLPLPPHLDERLLLNTVHPDKDVDGLHPENIAKLAMQQERQQMWDYDNALDRLPFSVPCTPLGCVELLDRYNITMAGKHVVMVGRSNMVGLPLSMLMLHRRASVTIVHSQSQNIEALVSQGDIVVVAVGKAHLVTASWLKEGAVVVDVGINSIDLSPAEQQARNTKRNYRLVGDVDFDAVESKCSMITPVPGGVGPMTIAMLLRNTVNACLRARGQL